MIKCLLFISTIPILCQEDRGVTPMIISEKKKKIYIYSITFVSRFTEFTVTQRMPLQGINCIQGAGHVSITETKTNRIRGIRQAMYMYEWPVEK